MNFLIADRDDLKNKIKVNILHKRRKWILVLSVDSVVNEDTFSDVVRKILDDSQLGTGLFSEIADKLEDP